jgi:hypothetical protein
VKKNPYTLSVFTGSIGVVNLATLNNNKTCEVKLIRPDTIPNFILERIALLRVADNSAEPVIADVGRQVGSSFYTVYINIDEYQQIRALPNA